MKEVIVTHVKYGKGTVMSQKDKYLKVKFDNAEAGEKTFIYPDAFSKFISYEDKKLQKEITETLRVIKQKADEKAAAIEAEKIAAEKEKIKAFMLTKAKKKAPAKKKVSTKAAE